MLRLTVLLSVGVLLAVAPVALAQAPEQTAPKADAPVPKDGDGDAPKTVTDGDAPEDELAAASGDIAKLEAEARGAEGDDRAIIEEQLAERRDELRGLLSKRLGDDEARTPAVEAAAQKLLRADLRRVTRELALAKRALKRAFKARERTRGPERLEIEDDIHDSNDGIDTLLAYIDGNADLRKALAPDAKQQPERALLLKETPERATNLAASIAASKDSLAKLGGRKVSSDEATAAKEDDMSALRRRVESSIGSLKKTITLLEKYELDAAEYQQIVIETTGDVTADILDTEVALGLGKKYFLQVKNWFINSGPTLLFKLILFVLIILLAKLVAAVARRVALYVLGRSKGASVLLRQLVSALVGRLIMLIGVLIGLWQFGFSPTGILAGLGLVGLIIGLALQSTLSSFASGVLILAYRPFDQGDLIESNGHKGTVKEMNLMSTVLLTLDNQRVVVPNNKVWGEVIKNVNCEGQRRVDMVFGISYADDVDRAKTILDAILDGDTRVLAEPEPVVRVHTLGASSVDFAVRPWVAPDDYWDVYWDVTREVKVRFDAEGISIPFPQRDVHIKGGSAAA